MSTQLKSDKGKFQMQALQIPESMDDLQFPFDPEL